MKLVTYIALGLGGLFLFGFNRRSEALQHESNLPVVGNYGFISPVENIVLRSCDPEGCGEYNAPRGNIVHKGIDIVSLPGDNVYAPISGKIRNFFAYSGVTEMTGVEIESGNLKVKLFYVSSIVGDGSVITSGTKIGNTQDVAGFLGTPNMTPHIHTEVLVNNVKVNPTNYFV
jgi:murein DD-endopeptidase MepM/ murein hydrolase activator NlpD